MSHLCSYVIFPQQGRNTTYASILMAEIVSSAVAQETISQILSGLVQKYEEKEKPDARTNLERLEMAHIRLEAALETSEKWQITDGSLLRWRKKLKRAAQECDDTLHKYKHIILEKEQIEQEVEEIMLPKAIDYFHQNTGARIYKMIWKSKHGSALIQVEKASMRTRRTLEGTRKTKVLQGQGQEFRSRTELVSTAIVQETVSHIISGLAQKFEDNEESNANRNMERLEMAHIRLEAALATSDKWKITDASLLRWRRKLKRAAQECNDTLHKCKQRIIEDEQIEWEVEKTLHGCTEIKHENTENFWGC
ncbi:hypothetical protein HU200_066504 [Digitaria exilis]|uniref:Disease resistance N-terminal domain-containing protein n=1 Tax=Digitaria exilis TaxID=1010633 RepID=A0A835A250_9POAL|nr:hypothetical protein HU200_066504 [Digitaria exilis]